MYTTHVKSMTFGQVLNMGSAHVASVHAMWPAREIRRLQRLTSDSYAVSNAKKMCLYRLSNYGMPQYSTKNLNRFFPVERQQWMSATYARMAQTTGNG